MVVCKYMHDFLHATLSALGRPLRRLTLHHMVKLAYQGAGWAWRPHQTRAPAQLHSLTFHAQQSSAKTPAGKVYKPAGSRPQSSWVTAGTRRHPHTKEPARRLHPEPACLARRLTAPARCRAPPARPESGSGSQSSTARCAPRLQAAQPGRHRWTGAPVARPPRCRRAQPTWRVHYAVQSRTQLLVQRDRCARSYGSGAPALLGHSGVVARRRAPSAPAPATLQAELGPGQVLLGDTALHWRGVWAGMPLAARKTALQPAELSTVPQEAVRSCSKQAHRLGWASAADGRQAQSIPCSHGAATQEQCALLQHADGAAPGYAS